MLLLLLLACPPSTSDDSTADSGCRSDAECTDGQSCWAPGACNVGDYQDPADECVAGSPCGDGGVCQSVPETCGVAQWYQCAAPCPDRACAADELCDEGTGLCARWMCTDGYTCPAFTHCDALGDAPNGCVRDSCTDDDACGLGFCVDGACHEAPGTCDYAHP